jgi:hypothetical protein
MLQEPSKVLDRGGKPTVRDLLSSLVFNPNDGTIRLNGDRIVMQRATAVAELRRELVRLIGTQETRVFLMRLGFLSGQADARFVRTSWPNLDAGDAFTAGTRLHTFSGVVRVETVFNTYDFRKKRFSAEFLWHDSVEAAEFRKRPTAEPMCWTQIGYASGYASEFFDTLIIYKEVECAAQGHSHCRVVGKPADVWGAADPDVILFRERIVGAADGPASEPLRKVVARATESATSELDRLILAPVRAELDRLAAVVLPVMISGASGTGRSRAARYLHRASGAAGGEFRRVFGAQVDLELCSEIARSARGSRRGVASETILIDAAETIPPEVQAHLTRALEEGMLCGGPRIIALLDESQAPDCVALSPGLGSMLRSLSVRMPELAQRPGQRAALARETMAVLAVRMGVDTPRLSEEAEHLIEAHDWPGNLRQMRNVLTAMLGARREDGPVTSAEIEAQLARFAVAAPSSARGAAVAPVETLLETMIAGENFSLSEFEQSAYRIAMERARGNLSAAARLLGLTRAQLAYRINGGRAPAQ